MLFQQNIACQRQTEEAVSVWVVASICQFVVRKFVHRDLSDELAFPLENFNSDIVRRDIWVCELYKAPMDVWTYDANF